MKCLKGNINKIHISEVFLQIPFHEEHNIWTKYQVVWTERGKTRQINQSMIPWVIEHALRFSESKSNFVGKKNTEKSSGIKYNYL